MDIKIYVCFLLSSVFCISESSFCSPDMEYHDHTRTCLKLFERREYYVQAKSFCQRNVSGGKDNSKRGYLVRIYDNTTDNFVKDYLRRNGVNTALIGLNDRAIQGVFRWDDIEEEVTYFGWARIPFTQNSSMNSVVIESDGWREHSGQQERFICQVEADLPEAKMTCPPAQISDLDHQIACVVNLRDPSIFRSSSLTKDNEFVARCGPSSCTSTLQYDAVVRSGTTTVAIPIVSRDHEGNWTCAIQFDGSSYVARDSCLLQVLERPQCPTNLSIIAEGKSFLLSWMDGDDGGAKQTFVVLQAASNKEFTEVGQINDTLGNTTTYKVAGLEPNTAYIFSVNVYNDIGTTDCSHITVSGRTSATEAVQTDTDATIIIIVAGCVILIVVGVVICFLVRTKFKNKSEAACLVCQHTTEPKTTEVTEMTDQLRTLTLPTDDDGYLMAAEARQNLVSQTQSGLVPQLVARDNTAAELHRRQSSQISIQAPTNQANENPYDMVEDDQRAIQAPRNQANEKHYDMIEDELPEFVNNSNFCDAHHQELHQGTSPKHVAPFQDSDTTNYGNISSGNVKTIMDYTSLYETPDNNTYNNGEHQYAVFKLK
ncbi:uncharacterized protein LOC131927952 [Physella acuta]|uniref:uncharacterized protein LOC131927952 n=1 Tax=Physella acuta TaxID=109671 RepID=UPI0027DE64F7|nr:uncharacterized protein LOC131927952 [Physella acuta]